MFFSVKDPRVGGRCLHPLRNILFITLCALISGCNEWKGIENFGKEKMRWLSQFIDLENGIPSHLTFARVISMINPESLERCVQEWFHQLYELMKHAFLFFASIFIMRTWINEQWFIIAV